jgi:hypothetical protein
MKRAREKRAIKQSGMEKKDRRFATAFSNDDLILLNSKLSQQLIEQRKSNLQKREQPLLMELVF